MRIQTNIESLNAYRNLNTTNRAMSKSLERLSSGFRINRAADDAAGLSISEKMRGQISGLNQAVRNAQDGISLIQTAEGALNETHAILQRMRELSSQAANDTLTSEDRQALQEEMDELTVEISRIADTTEFNTENLLEGGFEDRVLQIGANQGQTMEISIGDMRAEALGVAGAEGFEHEVVVTVDTMNTGTDESDLAIGAGAQTYEVETLDETVNVEDNDGSNEVDANYALTDGDGNYVAVSSDGESYSLLVSDVDDLSNAEIATPGDTADGDIDPIEFGDPVTSGEVTIDTDFGSDEITATGTANIQIEEGADLDSGTYTVVGDGHADVGDGDLGLEDSQGNIVALDSGSDGTWVLYADTTETAFTIEGSNLLAEGDEITISGDGGIDISTTGAATDALATLDDAIDNVSTERSTLGAVQNRLDHTITNLEVAAENLTAAESRIRDVDMAAEMMEFTKSQILVQAGTSMLAQANMAPQAVLQLLG